MKSSLPQPTHPALSGTPLDRGNPIFSPLKRGVAQSAGVCRFDLGGSEPSRLGCLLLFFALAVAGSAAEPVTFYPDWFPGPQFAGFYVAADRGFFREAGLEVAFVPFKFGAKTNEAIAASSVCALGSIEGYIFLQQRAAGPDLRALAAVLQESPAGFMSLTATGIASVRDFSGKRIGVHKFADPLYHWFLHRAGMSETAATLVPVGNDLGLLTRGEVQAMQGYAIEEFERLQQMTGGQARFLSFRELGFDAYSEILYTTAPQHAQHHAALQAFLAATQRGWIHALAHPDDALAALRARLGTDFDEPYLRASLAALAPYVSGGGPPLAPMRPEKWRQMQAACVEMGFLAKAEPVENFLPPGPTSSPPP